ncbi:MAG: hypothetical protein MZV64_44345 [Ignavibacteriales bacterium]|nr:hypothetical protein [Ignavibacteriales bacterium]
MRSSPRRGARRACSAWSFAVGLVPVDGARRAWRSGCSGTSSICRSGLGAVRSSDDARAACCSATPLSGTGCWSSRCSCGAARATCSCSRGFVLLAARAERRRHRGLRRGHRPRRCRGSPTRPSSRASRPGRSSASCCSGRAAPWRRRVTRRIDRAVLPKRIDRHARSSRNSPQRTSIVTDRDELAALLERAASRGAAPACSLAIYLLRRRRARSGRFIERRLDAGRRHAGSRCTRRWSERLEQDWSRPWTSRPRSKPAPAWLAAIRRRVSSCRCSARRRRAARTARPRAPPVGGALLAGGHGGCWRRSPARRAARSRS